MLRTLFTTCAIFLTMSQEVPNPYNPAPVAKAIINVNGARGSVTVWGGYVAVDLDLTGFQFNKTAVNESHVQAGISYHIHAKNTITPLGGVGAACGASFTGGHYDPWFACGPATDQQQCISKNVSEPLKRCVNRPKANYSCSNANFKANPLTACEVGDWSGKYGKLMPLISTSLVFKFNSSSVQMPPSQYEISSVDLYNQKLSVVFHAGPNGARFLCAAFGPDVTTNRSTIAPVMGLQAATAASTRIVADFKSVGGPLLQFGGGEVGMDLLSALGLTQGQPCGKDQIPFYTLNMFPWNTTKFGGKTSASGAVCADPNNVGFVWDPTVRCPINSGSPYCTNKLLPTRCLLPFNYTAEALTSQYNSAQGSLFLDASRFPKTIDALSKSSLFKNGIFALPYWLLDTSKLEGWVATITCPNTTKSLCTRLTKVGPGYGVPTKAPAAPTPSTTGSPTKPGTGAAERVLTFFGIVLSLIGIMVV